MKIKLIEFRNFASYGNKLQKIEFENNTGNFYLVLGQNGVGKSSISDVIKFSLYGKLQNKNLKDIPNRFNANAWCRIVLEKDTHTEVIIERGLNPNVLKCFVNGMIYDQAGKKNVQNFIEEEVIGLPFYVFNNIISLSVNDFKSFLSMSNHDKRMIIDKIFNLGIINRMRSMVREESRKIRDLIMLLENESNILENSINTSQIELDKLLERINLSNEELKLELQNKIIVLSEKIKTIEEHAVKIYENEKKLIEKKTALQLIESNLLLTIRQADEREKLYNNDKCPTCMGNLHTDEHQNIMEEWRGKKEYSLSEIQKLKEEFTRLNEISEKILQNKQKIVEQRTKIDTHIKYNSSELKKLTDNTEPEQTESLKNIIENSTQKKDDAKRKKINAEKKINFYKILEDVFGDRGVKQLAIKRILPSLNSEINRIIKELNMEYRVMFDDEFNANIMHLGYPVSAAMLSTGERKKIDFAVLISLIKMMKLKFHGLNLIFLDEIFSSIDQDAIYHVIKILHAICKELNLNTFVINHATLPSELFDYVMNVTKNNGFSNFEIEKA
jgi:DNA repair exonuclease SbcCD ATPase subunit